MVESLMTRPQEDVAPAGEVVHQRGPRRSPGFVVRRTVRRFGQDRGAGAASVLTLQTTLTLLATVVALLGALAAAATGDRVVADVEGVLAPVLPAEVLTQLSGVLTSVAGVSGGWVVLGVGAAAALLAAVGYVAAVRAATNRAWQVAEGRSGWRLAGGQLLLALATYAVSAIAAALLLTSGSMAGPVAAAFGLHLGTHTLEVWSYAVWPLLAVALIALVALLHRVAPNVRFGRRRLITPGSFVTILCWLAVGAGLAAYLAWYPSWNRALGTVVAVAAVLLWLWLVHAALVLGAELDAELERGRKLQAGRPAEERLQVSTRADRASTRAELRERQAVERMREIRIAAAAHGNPDDRPFGRPHGRH